MFTLHSTNAHGRRGQIMTMHGAIETPTFFPVGTGGAMRGITTKELKEIGAEVLLCNTYHLHLRPGEDIVAEAGGLHSFIGWDRPILTDSGGFQVFSLRERRTATDEGVTFQSHIDGSTHALGPKSAMEIQHKLGSNIIMCFDECPPSKAPREEVSRAVDRTIKWAAECKRHHTQLLEKRGSSDSPLPRPLLFGIIQGGLERDLRKKCAEELISIGFDGYAVGGLAVGESEEEMLSVLDDICPLLPKDKPRYLMGVGHRRQLPLCVARGIDFFDCVMPMREARHGTIYVSDGSTLRITLADTLHDHTPLDPNSPAPIGRATLKSYLSYLLRAGERLGETIACTQNLAVTLALIKEIRAKTEEVSY
jgi:queuine tRNA-ribosyltransferase